jgi:hypothetical protein
MTSGQKAGTLSSFSAHFYGTLEQSISTSKGVEQATTAATFSYNESHFPPSRRLFIFLPPPHRHLKRIIAYQAKIRVVPSPSIHRTRRDWTFATSMGIDGISISTSQNGNSACTLVRGGGNNCSQIFDHFRNSSEGVGVPPRHIPTLSTVILKRVVVVAV